MKIEDVMVYGEIISPLAPHVCEICGKLSWKRIRSIGYYGEYGWHSRYYYHHECVLYAIQNPEKYGNHKVDIAIDIHRCIEYWTKLAKDREQKQSEYRLSELRRMQGLS